MGTWKCFTAALAYRDYSMRQARQATVRTYKSTGGTSSSTIAINGQSGGIFDVITKAANQASPYEPLTAYTCADLLENYSVNDYAVAEVGTVTKTVNRSNQDGKSLNIYTLVCTNNTENSISVGCVKFTKPIPQNAYNTDTLTCLMYAYYFDNPITIGAGETKTFTITIKAD